MYVKQSNNADREMAVVAGEVVTGDRNEAGQWWWNKVVDVEEAKNQILFALPMVLTNVIYYLIPLVSVMFAGHLGDLQLAASTLANSWAGITGFIFMIGLSVALETLCGQAFGAQSYKVMGVYLQASCMISFAFSLLISLLWWFTKPILLILHQNPEVSKEAAIYMKYLIPGIFAYGNIQSIMRFLQTQSIAWPLVVCSLIPFLLQIVIVYVLVHHTNLGFCGAPLGTSIALWISLAMLIVYVSYAKTLKETWKGLSKESFGVLLATLKLALASAAMICLEYWAFEVMIILAGLLPNSKASTSLMAMCLGTEIVAYNFTYGLSAAASTRVSNELGAGKPDKAKHAASVTMKLSIVLTIMMLLALGLGHNLWASLYSGNINIIKSFASMTPLVCISISLDSVQGILSGVSRGCGWQYLTTFINLGTYIGVGIPIACLCAFKFHLGVKGLWIGLICGLASQSGALSLVTYLKKWTALGLSTVKDYEDMQMEHPHA